jgi:hypothetical protein
MSQSGGPGVGIHEMPGEMLTWGDAVVKRIVISIGDRR